MIVCKIKRRIKLLSLLRIAVYTFAIAIDGSGLEISEANEGKTQ